MYVGLCYVPSLSLYQEKCEVLLRQNMKINFSSKKKPRKFSQSFLWSPAQDAFWKFVAQINGVSLIFMKEQHNIMHEVTYIIFLSKSSDALVQFLP